MSRGEFEVHYQQLLDIKTSNIICFEALLRWNHPQRGLTLPLEFISLAEDTGLIVPIGDWGLRTACADAPRWPHDVRVAVNISPAQFKNRKLVASATAGLASHALIGNPLRPV